MIPCIGWLEPMLNAIKTDPYNVPYPVVDSIEKDNFRIYPVEIMAQGLFNFMDLSYFPLVLPPALTKQRKSYTEPIA